MNERAWLECGDPGPMLGWMGYRLTDRQARLFAVACCRRIWDEFTNERVRRFVQVAQDYAEGKAMRSVRLAAEIEAIYLYADTTVLGAQALSHDNWPPAEPFPEIAAVAALGKTPAHAYLYASASFSISG